MRKVSTLAILFIFSIITLSLGQFAILSGGGGVPIYIFDFVVGIYSLFGLTHFLIAKKTFKLSKSQLLFLLFSGIALLSLLTRLTTLAVEEVILSSFYLIRWTIYLISGIVTVNAVKKKIFTLNFVIKNFLISALFVSLGGFVQLVVLPDFTVLDPFLGWDPHKNRLASTFFDPNFTGGYLALVIGLTLSLHFNKVRKISSKEAVFYVLIPLVALILTFSRSSWGMLAVIVMVIGALRARFLLVLAIIMMFLTYFAVPRVQTRLTGVTDPADSAAFRLVSWKNTLEIAQQNLFLGVGFNSFRYAQRDYGFFESGTLGGNAGGGSDSSFLLVLATTGIFGLVVFLMGYFWRLKNFVLLPLILGLFLHSQFVNSLFYPQILFLWLISWNLFD